MKIDFNSLYISLIGEPEKTKIDENISAIVSDRFLSIYIDNTLVFDWFIYNTKPTYYYKIPKKAIRIINNWAKNTIKQIEEKENIRKNTIQHLINALYK